MKIVDITCIMSGIFFTFSDLPTMAKFRQDLLKELSGQNAENSSEEESDDLARHRVVESDDDDDNEDQDDVEAAFKRATGNEDDDEFFRDSYPGESIGNMIGRKKPYVERL